MAKTSAVTGGSGENIHTRTTSDGVESQAVVLAIDGSDSVVPVDATHGVAVQGAVASGDPDSGDPVKVGGIYNAAPPTFTDGDRADLQQDANGNLRVVVGNTLDAAIYLEGAIAPAADDASADNADLAFINGMVTTSRLALYDGTNYDRARGDSANGLDVDVTRLPALPAGTNNIGDVDVLTLPAVALDAATLTALETITIGTALPAGSNNIGDVDVLTVPAPLSTTGGGTEATAQRVTIANDSTGVLSVDDNGGSLTVDGPLTDAQLRASVVPVDATPAAPVATDYLPVRLTTGSAFLDSEPTYRGRASTFRTPGRAGTAGQKIFAIHNATGSAKIVRVNRIKVDLVSTAVRAITVEPSLIRLWRFTTLPTNGSTLAKVPKDTGLASSSSVTLWQDASADRTGSGTTLTVTLPANNVLTQEYGSRNFTAVGQEAADKIEFMDNENDYVVLRALEGICVFLDYATATFNPTTDIWVVTCDWDEF